MSSLRPGIKPLPRMSASSRRDHGEPNTRKLYSHHARRFFRWAGERGLTLEAIAADDVEEYAAEVVRVRSKHEASIYLTPVRGVFRSLVHSSVLAQSPFAASSPSCKRSTADELHEPPMPETLDEWQAAVDAAEALLVLDSMKQYGLIEGGPDTDLDRCAGASCPRASSGDYAALTR